jgi:hypothetical protein
MRIIYLIILTMLLQGCETLNTFVDKGVNPAFKEMVCGKDYL